MLDAELIFPFCKSSAVCCKCRVLSSTVVAIRLKVFARFPISSSEFILTRAENLQPRALGKLRDFHIDILQVVLACAFYDNVFFFFMFVFRSFTLVFSK